MKTDSSIRKKLVAHAKSVSTRRRNFLKRRPHRSFTRTRRRDYVASMPLPGYLAFANQVTKTVWKNKKLFIPLALMYVLLYSALVGVVSQETYAALSDTIQTASTNIMGETANLLGKASILLVSLGSSAVDTSGDTSSQVISGLLLLMLWLTVVWLLRNKLAGHPVRLRDGLYNSGGPILATFMIVLVLAVQLLPVAIASIGYSAASTSGLLTSGAPAMLFWIGALLLGLLSVYWMTASLFAMVIITLPGMYPMRALRTAGDIVLGRRVRIILRWLYMLLAVVVAWLVIMIPLVLLESWLRSLWPWLASVPIIPFAVVAMSAVSLIWTASYIYLFYRKVVDGAA